MLSFIKLWPLMALIVPIFLEVAGKGSKKHAYRSNSPEEPSAERLEKLMNTTSFKLLVPTAGSASYPLDPLSATEIRLAALIIRMYDRSLKLQFQCIGLHDPEKARLISSFLTGTNPPLGSFERRAGVLAVDRNTQTPYWVIVNLSTQKVESFTPARPDQASPYITADDTDVVDNVIFSDPNVIQRLNALGFNDFNSIDTDVWEAGYVADNPNYSQVRKLVQVFLYAILGPEDLLYAHPFGFAIYVDLGAQVVRGIENLPLHEGFDTQNTEGNSVPLAPVSLYLTPDGYRQDIRPIAISRPKGVSFQVNDRQVSWQNFKFRIGYNLREGPIIYHVSYTDNGNLRPLFYRLSVSESFGQYGDSRPPNHRKSSFDMGNWEFGNSLISLTEELCRGSPYYFDAVSHNVRAETRTIKNAVCVVEEPDGIQWAYYDYIADRTDVKQSQRLAVNSLSAIGNGNYLVSWRFYQDATVELAIRFTGILSTSLTAIDIKSPPPPYGNIVAPKVYAQNYQYFIGARVDADIDGVKNTVAMEDVVSLSQRVNPQINPYGNGMVTNFVILKTPAEARTDNILGRQWRIFNPTQLNPVNGRPTSYKLSILGPAIPNLLSVDSPIRDRITWANHNMWVLPYNDDQIFIDNLYLDCGVNKWTNENATANIVDTDVTLWPVFGFASTPDLEDWPMLSRIPEVGFQLKPSNFFTKSPILDLPSASETTAYDDKKTPGGPGTGWGTGRSITGVRMRG